MLLKPARHSMSSLPVKYPTDEAWSNAMNDFVSSITGALNSVEQKISANRTGTGSELGYEAWLKLDKTPFPPDAAFEEGVFAVMWGPNDVQFYPETTWKRQIDLMSEIHNSEVWYQSHSDLKEGESGTDNLGKSVNFYDILWYAMGSYLIGKNTIDNNSYFGYHISGNVISWYDEFDHIDLGEAIDNYMVSNNSGRNIYWREFEKGYVFVNPTESDVSNISLSKPCKILNHENFKDNPDNLQTFNTISLKSHRAAILLKETFDFISLPPESAQETIQSPSQESLLAPPKGLKIIN